MPAHHAAWGICEPVAASKPKRRGLGWYPPGTDLGNDQHLEAVARELVDDPRGRALAQAYKASGNPPGKNISVEWFDLSWLPDNLGEIILSHLETAEARNIIRGRSYKIRFQRIDYTGNEDLFEELGASPESWLIQVRNTNVTFGTHSELIPLRILKAVISGVLQNEKGLPKAAADAQANAILAVSSLWLASGNGMCFKICNSRTKSFKGRYAVSYYGHTEQEHIASLARVHTIMVKAIPLLGEGAAIPTRQENANAVEQQIAANLGIPADTITGPQSCHPQAGMALMRLASSTGCGNGQSSAIGKAIESSNLGGVDFSTLQMRYMSDNPDSTGLQYSLSGQKDTSAAPQGVDTALNVLIDNAADLRTWLVLSPDEFWVNLNPSEPDRIIDSQLGETNAGRELLDADFQLKRSSATLMNPNTKPGARYWRDLAGSSSSVCYGSRMWIVPGQVQVREDGGSLYILSARLAVKAVPDHVADMPADCHYNAQTDARGQRLDQTMIVPLITKMVNTAPEYAPIRRAFMARIVAQWIRDRYASGQRTSFDSLIDSGNIGPAQLQDGWQPQQVFNAYVKSLKDGEFTYNTTFHQGGATYIQKITIGGVDFTSLNPTTVSAAQMNQHVPATGADGEVVGKPAHVLRRVALARRHDRAAEQETGPRSLIRSGPSRADGPAS